MRSSACDRRPSQRAGGRPAAPSPSGAGAAAAARACAAAVSLQVVRSQALAARFELDVLSTAMAGDLARIRRFEFGKLWRSLVLLGRVARRSFGAGRADLAYLTLSAGGWAFHRDVLLIALLRAAGIRRVLHLHGRGFARARAPWSVPLYRFAFADARVIVLGEPLYREIARFVARERVSIVPNGVRDARAEARPTAPQRPALILFLSNMLEAKGPLVLLEALALLARAGAAFEAVFAGAWRGDLTPEAFAAQVQALGLDGRVHHRGAVHGGGKDRLFAAADIFVLPTHYVHEALPLVVIEAMMHGLPVVTTPVGALPELVTDGENGYSVAPRDPAALADALLRLLNEPERRRRYGAAGRARYEADLTDTRFEQRLLDAVEFLPRPTKYNDDPLSPRAAGTIAAELVCSRSPHHGCARRVLPLQGCAPARRSGRGKNGKAGVPQPDFLQTGISCSPSMAALGSTPAPTSARRSSPTTASTRMPR